MKTIAKAAGVSTATVYAWSSKGKWQRPKPAASAAAAESKAGAEQLAGRVRCPSCQTLTGTDPCEACGQKIPRKGW